MLCINIKTLGDYCSKPQHKVASSVRKRFGKDWKHVGLALGLDYSEIENIELNKHDNDDRAFQMLEIWIQRNVNACYCKLISAMSDQGLEDGVQVLKQKVKPSKFYNIN